jgi:hypothetical protein
LAFHELDFVDPPLDAGTGMVGVLMLPETIHRRLDSVEEAGESRMTGQLCAVKAADRIPAAGRGSWERCFRAIDLTGW